MKQKNGKIYVKNPGKFMLMKSLTFKMFCALRTLLALVLII